MTREERTLALILLVCFIYGMGFWVQSGTFILPSPLFPLFALIGGGFICYLNFREEPIVAVLLSCFLVLQFLFSPFFLLLALKEQQFESIQSSVIPEIVKILSYLAVTCGLGLLMFRHATHLKMIGTGTFLVLFSTAIALNSQVILGLSFLASTLLLRIKNHRTSAFYLIPLLLFILNFSEWLFLRFVG
jgi:hypothetical protein